MLAKCANPECSKPFHYLREGKIFRIDLESVPAGGGGRRPVRIEHFWLCGTCSTQMTLLYRKGEGVVLMRLEGQSSGGYAAAS